MGERSQDPSKSSSGSNTSSNSTSYASLKNIENNGTTKISVDNNQNHATPYKLYLKINANRAADLVTTTDTEKETNTSKYSSKKFINPVLVAKINDKKKVTQRKTNTNQPSWDDELNISLKRGDLSSILMISVWDKHKRYKNYLGELRLSLENLFLREDGSFTEKTELKWYGLSSNSTVHAFVTGSILLSFELFVKKRKSRVVKGKADVGSNIGAQMQGLRINVTEQEFRAWLRSLIEPDSKALHSLTPDEQGFYDEAMTDASEMESLATKKSAGSALSNDIPLNNSKMDNFLNVRGNDRCASSFSEQSSYLSTDAYSDGNLSHGGGGRKEKPKRRLGIRKINHSRNDLFKDNKFELRGRQVLGVLFIEIVSCEDLPPVTNFTRTSFDMDPFVVVTFGKKTFRTSWKRHTLSPIFNERVAFEVMAHESNYTVQFSILDRDRFSFHDDVAHIKLGLRDLIELSPFQSLMDHGVSGSDASINLEPGFSTGDNDTNSNSNVKILEDDNIVKSVRRGRFSNRRKIVESTVDTSKFKVMSLNLDLHDQKYLGKYSPKLKIRVRFETYNDLRKEFWRVLLKQYDLGGTKEDEAYDYMELISLLDALGTKDADSLVEEFYKNLRKNYSADSLTYDEIIEQLEIHVSLNDQNSNRIFVFDTCPLCSQKRLSKKQDIDIITHFAICASKDWSIVNKLLVSSYATPRHATKKWYSKALIKLTYGKYKLGGNTANIFVQDRLTGIIVEEKMSVYVRLGIRLLYKGLDKAKSKRVRLLLSSLSKKQGKKFDSPSSKADIASFIKFHKLSLDDCLIDNPDGYPTFNEFFYRKLKPNARVIEDEENEGIVSSPADCRCTVFDSVDDATSLWIKGRNFSLAKLFNGNFQNLNTTNLYKPDQCSLGIFRLAPQDYHRFHSPVSGTIGQIKYIEGEYYTVNPMAIRSELDVFGENVRSVIPIHTEEYGTVIMIAVGAMMVGSICLTKQDGDSIERGEEVGYFKFGGSTIILLFDRTKFTFDSDLVSNSKSCIETLVRVGQSIGHSPGVNEFKRDHVEFDQLPQNTKLQLIRVLTGGDLTDKHQLSNWEASRAGIEEDDEEDIYVSDSNIDFGADSSMDEEGSITSG
ncbi:Psd2 protein [Candida orthopsilosis Co 90-125]|uniref:Phosphatidylserine decarboxylase proenzyme 2 n=1 Tax=Candida orthopsilosis (strain 90-125) TaxID=1136231 RepID=H8X999_CANO9|nr:Psd2 protein [Candida orthopsilosis Co 90-125]CCG24398.1 Psd2 protein [Candida orthopsilosis Co 90-125]